MGDGSRSRGDDDERASSSGLMRVVWLRQMLHRWQSSSSSSATARRSSPSGDGDEGDGANGPDASTDRRNDDGDSDRNPLLPRVVVVVEERAGPGHGRGCGGPPQDDAAEGCESPMTPMTPDSPAGVPRGCCPVYVGTERRRFVVPMAYLGMPVFRRLLEKAEEEFEFCYSGGVVTIPCDTEAFKYILVVMDRHRHGLIDDEGNAKDGEQPGGSSSQQAR